MRKRLIEAVCKIAENDLKSLDVKILQSTYKIFRCRVGKARILFQKTESGNRVMDIGFRGDIYKGF